MSALRQLKKLLLGETWLLPLGLAAVMLALGLVVEPLAGEHAWRDVGGFGLLAGVVILLVASVARGARPPAG